MPGAVIAIDQDRPDGTSFGSPGVARQDLWKNHTVRPRCATTGNNSILWSLEDVPPGSSAAITPGTETETTCDFNPDTLDTISLKLTTNGGGPGNVQILSCAVTYDEDGNLQSRGWRIPALGEQGAQSNFDGQTRGWDPALRKIITDIRTGAIPGSGEISIQVGGADLPVRSFLNFIGALRAVDNEEDDSTDVVLDFLFRTRTVTTSTATIQPTDCIILVKRSFGTTLTMPVPAAGRTILIVDALGINPNEGAISLTKHSSESINGDSENPYLCAVPRSWILVTSDGTSWFAVQLSPTGPASGSANTFTYPLQSGVISTALATAASKLALGAVPFNPAVLTPGPGKTLHVRFEAIIETSDAGRPAFVDLYDVEAAATVASSELNTTALAATYLSVDLPDLVDVDLGTYQARLWMDPQDPGTVVTCAYAALVLTVS
jgi:hypothetical protein